MISFGRRLPLHFVLLAGFSVTACSSCAKRAPEDVGTGTGSPAFRVAGLDLSYIPAEFQAAIVLHPRRVLTSNLLAGLPVNETIDNLRLEEVPDPRSIDQLIFAVRVPENFEPASLLGSAPFPLSENGEKTGAPQETMERAERCFGVILRMAEPTEARALLATIAPNDDEIVQGDHEGRSYYKAPVHEHIKGQRTTMTWMACMAVDGRTLLFAEEQTLFKMLAAKDVKSPLLQQLAKCDPGADAVIAFSLEGLSDAAVKASKSLQSAGAEVSALPIQIKSGWITASITSGSLLKGSLVATSEDAARKLESSGRKGLAELKSLHGEFRELLAMTPYATDLKPALDFGDTLLDTVALARTGSELVLELKTFESIQQLVQDLQPLIQRDRAEKDAAWHRQTIVQIGSALRTKYFSEEPALHFGDSEEFFDDRGGRVLSWRQRVLPEIGEYRMFSKLNPREPATSAHNKPVLAKMPRIFLDSPRATNNGTTRFAVLTGPETLFPPGRTLTVKDVTDGTANTIMLVELPPEKAIPWTSTTDVAFNPKQPLNGIAPISNSGMRVVMVDGTVKTLKSNVSPELFKTLVTPAGMETIDASAAFVKGVATFEFIPVKGVVRLNGAPVKGASVTFQHFDESNPSASAVTEADGTFVAMSGKNPGCVAGRYKVSITARDRQGDSLMPLCYATSATTPLTIEVKHGDNQYVLETSD